MNKIICVSMVKDELDVFPYVLGHLFDQGITEHIIADNMSTDGTLQFLAECEAPNVHLIFDEDPAYHQAAKMNGLVRKAVEIYGEDIIVLPYDADEAFYSLDPTKTLSEALLTMPCDVAVGTVYDHVPHPSDQKTGNPLIDMAHRMPHIKSPPSVAFKYHPDAHLAMGNHSVGHPGNSGEGVMAVRHFQYRSYEQYVRKLRNGKKAYEATTGLDDHGQHWREGGAKTDEELWNEWQVYISQPLIYDPAPVKGL